MIGELIRLVRDVPNLLHWRAERIRTEVYAWQIQHEADYPTEVVRQHSALPLAWANFLDALARDLRCRPGD